MPKRNDILFWAGCVIIAGAVVAGVMLRGGIRGDETPDELSKEKVAATELVKFVSSPRFGAGTEENKAWSRDALNGRLQDIDAAHNSKEITDEEWREARRQAWLGRRLREMDSYFAKPAGKERAAYLNLLIDRHQVRQPPYMATKDLGLSEFLAREKKTWLAARSAQWEEFRKNLAAYRKANP